MFHYSSLHITIWQLRIILKCALCTTLGPYGRWQNTFNCINLVSSQWLIFKFILQFAICLLIALAFIFTQGYVFSGEIFPGDRQGRWLVELVLGEADIIALSVFTISLYLQWFRTSHTIKDFPSSLRILINLQLNVLNLSSISSFR